MSHTPEQAKRFEDPKRVMEAVTFLEAIDRKIKSGRESDRGIVIYIEQNLPKVNY